ncbi:hypothetical protein EDB85DRAFT_542328 [Lactarius pseudohatsudake]|nr:hypothetical protein EDB85DRAFT_542328 [Lactarius pseudohatsudake]
MRRPPLSLRYTLLIPLQPSFSSLFSVTYHMAKFLFASRIISSKSLHTLCLRPIVTTTLHSSPAASVPIPWVQVYVLSAQHVVMITYAFPYFSHGRLRYRRVTHNHANLPHK